MGLSKNPMKHIRCRFAGAPPLLAARSGQEKRMMLLEFADLAADKISLLLRDRKIAACHACSLLDSIGAAGCEYAGAFGFVVELYGVVHCVVVVVVNKKPL